MCYESFNQGDAGQTIERNTSVCPTFQHGASIGVQGKTRWISQIDMSQK